MHKPIPASLRAEIDSPDTIAVIAARHGVSSSTILKWCRLRGIPPRGRGAKPAALPASVIAEYERGETSTAIAARHGTYAFGVLRFLKARGVAIRKPGPALGSTTDAGQRKVARERLGELLARVHRGEAYASIGRAYGISRQRVAQIAIAHGVRRNMGVAA